MGCQVSSTSFEILVDGSPVNSADDKVAKHSVFFYVTTRKEEKRYSRVNGKRPKKGQILNKSVPKNGFDVFCPGN